MGRGGRWDCLLWEGCLRCRAWPRPRRCPLGAAHACRRQKTGAGEKSALPAAAVPILYPVEGACAFLQVHYTTDNHRQPQTTTDMLLPGKGSIDVFADWFLNQPGSWTQLSLEAMAQRGGAVSLPLARPPPVWAVRPSRCSFVRFHFVRFSFAGAIRAAGLSRYLAQSRRRAGGLARSNKTPPRSHNIASRRQGPVIYPSFSVLTCGLRHDMPCSGSRPSPRPLLRLNSTRACATPAPRGRGEGE